MNGGVLTLNIGGKCENGCTCQRTAGLISVKVGSVNGAGSYKYCTHEKDTEQGIKGLNYGGQPLKILDSGGSTLFSNTHDRSEVVTVYYREDSNKSRIKAPLILGVKENTGAGYKWYENAGDGITWTKIDGTGDFPKTNKEPAAPQFLDKLKNLTCTLYHLHRVDISNDGQKSYHCQICGQYKVIVNRGSPFSGIYSRFYHTPTDDGTTYYLSYGGNLIKCQESSAKSNLISVIKNITISVYYWEGDEERKSPLLIELKQASTSKSEWYENKSAGGNNKIWNKVQDQYKGVLATENGLKTKLDYLNCTLNNAVRIKLGLDSGCHDSGNGNHKSRIKTRHNGTVDSKLKVSAYEYTSSEHGGGPFSIAEILLKDNRQKNQYGNLFFKGVTKVTSFASSCDPTNPFLICVEYSENGNKWYRRKHEGQKNTWEKKYGDLSGQIGDIFASVKKKLEVKECQKYIPPQEGIQIDISQQPNDTVTDTYEATSSSGNISILISKDYADLKKGLFRVTHQTTTGKTFKLRRDLNKGGIIRATTRPERPIDDVKAVEVYYWNGDLTRPILLGIKQNGETKTKYYSISSKNWIQGDNNEGKKLVHLLDDKNCQRNNTVPFDIKEPTKDHADGKSSCLKTRKITESGSKLQPPPGGEYIVKEYTIKGDARISRVTYGGTETIGIEPPGGKVSQLRVYKWKNDSTLDGKIPLLVEFISSGTSYWFENLDKESTKWRAVSHEDSKKFYRGAPLQGNYTEAVTKKLDEVNCRIHHTVKIEVSNKGDPDKYCHDRCIPNRIKVNAKYNPPGYTAYQHTSNIYRETFTVTSILNSKSEQEVTGEINFPLLNVSKIIVYFLECSGDYPVAIKIECGLGKSVIWLKNENEHWTQLNPKDDKSDILTCQKGSRSTSVQEPSTLYEGDSSDSGEEAQTSSPSIGSNWSFDWSLESLVSSLVQGIVAGPHKAVNVLARLAPKENTKTEPPVSKEKDGPLTQPAHTQDGGQTATLKASAPSPGTSSLDSPDNSSGSNPKSGSGSSPNIIKTTISVTTGILGTSTLACFAGWKLYNRYKGDPWVRQI